LFANETTIDRKKDARSMKMLQEKHLEGKLAIQIVLKEADQHLAFRPLYANQPVQMVRSVEASEGEANEVPVH
jgi:hypothetical protein